MTGPILAFCLCVSFQGGPPPPDRWIAEDKVKHFLASFVVTSIAATAVRATGADPEASAWAGAGVGAGLGIWKEVRDRGAEGATASVRDLVWDAGGVTAATALVLRAR